MTDMPNKIAFIDIDGTLVKGQTQVMLAIFLFRRGDNLLAVSNQGIYLVLVL
jgi:hydroxymethylpyrimidine pyrophosphatase-like HAD family hydrolase